LEKLLKPKQELPSMQMLERAACLAKRNFQVSSICHRTKPQCSSL
jgi:hypothetical protein